ncbi:NUDIX hydrolase [Thalassovita sp.]|uniref:NUDIX hydrolase n=1 Tax=Thalassovita sp. TaxID=1979401 RepID=UPI0029DE7294|nr:NUDIX hydrolase [Thalassovita sp.]
MGSGLGMVIAHDYMRGMDEDTDFHGAKLALFIGGQLTVIQRDDRPGLPWAGYLDLPGGGREAAETPVECVLRETYEELGLSLTQRDLVWGRPFLTTEGTGWFFAAQLTAKATQSVRFGSEGQCWALMPPEQYMTHPQAIPHFAARVRIVRQELGQIVCGPQP